MNFKNLLNKLKDPRILALIGFLIIVAIGIPLAVILTQQPTHINQNASFTGDQFDSCGNIQITPQEVPTACLTNKSQSGMTSHSSFLILKLVKTIGSGNQIIINWNGTSYFCPTHASLSGSNSACYLDPHSQKDSCTLSDSKTSCTISLPAHTPNAPYAGMACGYYQDDYAFVYGAGSFGGTGCHYGDSNFSSDNGAPGGALFCNAGDCVITTPTVTTSPTPFDTSTPTPTTTVTDTPTPTISVTPTITDTPTPGPSDTPGPSATPTPTTTVTDTPTPGPSSTPGPTVITNTPAPTLPETGPSNNGVVGFGILGGIVSIIGAAILFGL